MPLVTWARTSRRIQHVRRVRLVEQVDECNEPDPTPPTSGFANASKTRDKNLTDGARKGPLQPETAQRFVRFY